MQWIKDVIKCCHWARTTNIGLLYPKVCNNIGWRLIPIDVLPTKIILGDVSPASPAGWRQWMCTWQLTELVIQLAWVACWLNWILQNTGLLKAPQSLKDADELPRKGPWCRVYVEIFYRCRHQSTQANEKRDASKLSAIGSARKPEMCGQLDIRTHVEYSLGFIKVI